MTEGLGQFVPASTGRRGHKIDGILQKCPTAQPLELLADEWRDRDALRSADDDV
jgi:hypothetical protein